MFETELTAFRGIQRKVQPNSRTLRTNFKFEKENLTTFGKQ